MHWSTFTKGWKSGCVPVFRTDVHSYNGLNGQGSFVDNPNDSVVMCEVDNYGNKFAGSRALTRRGEGTRESANRNIDLSVFGRTTTSHPPINGLACFFNTLPHMHATRQNVVLLIKSITAGHDRQDPENKKGVKPDRSNVTL